MGVLPIEADAARVMDVLAEGGVGIIPLDVAYAIVGHSGESVRRMFEAKGRSFTKPNGMIANFEIFRELHIVGEREHDLVRAVTQDYGLPLAVVAPFRADHPLLAGLDPFAIERSTKAGTQDILLNSGPLADAMARLSLERSQPVLGSSANRSLTGSKYRLGDVDAEVRAAADIEIDYGLVRYHNPEGVSSTIIDLKTFEVHRWGVCFEQIRDILRRHFDIELPPRPAQPAA